MTILKFHEIQDGCHITTIDIQWRERAREGERGRERAREGERGRERAREGERGRGGEGERGRETSGERGREIEGGGRVRRTYNVDELHKPIKQLCDNSF